MTGLQEETGEITLEGRGLTSVRSGRLVFSGLDFSLSSGRALVLRGPNGSGKSTLLRLVAGLLQAREGEIHWSGEDVSLDPDEYRSNIHYVGHQSGLKTALTVAENIAFWARLYGARESVGDDVDKACRRLGLERLADLPVRYLSQGQKRRTALARLVAVPLPLWLLDEPNVGLDDFSNGVLKDLMAGHLAAGGMIMAATHTELGLDGAEILHLANDSSGDSSSGAANPASPVGEQ